MESMERSAATVSADELNAECLSRKYAALLEKPEMFPSERNWQFIIDHRMENLGTLLYRKYLVSWLMPEQKRDAIHRYALKYFPEYVSAVSRPYAVKLIYSDFQSAPEAFSEVVRTCMLFDARQLHHMVVQGEVELVISLLDVFQPEYTVSDAQAMRTLLGALRALPKLGRIEESRNIFSHEMRYYCPAGHSNSTSIEFCTHDGCGLNIYGLTYDQQQNINDFSDRIDALDSLLRHRS